MSQFPGLNLMLEGIRLRRLRFVAFAHLSGCINEKTPESMKEFGNHARSVKWSLFRARLKITFKCNEEVTANYKTDKQSTDQRSWESLHCLLTSLLHVIEKCFHSC